MAQYTLGKIAPVFKGAYSATTQYNRLDIVYYNGSSYVAKSDTVGSIPTNTAYWQIVAKASTWTDFSTGEKEALVEALTPILEGMTYTKEEVDSIISNLWDSVTDSLGHLSDSLNDLKDRLPISVIIGNKTFNDYE